MRLILPAGVGAGGGLSLPVVREGGLLGPAHLHCHLGRQSLDSYYGPQQGRWSYLPPALMTSENSNSFNHMEVVSALLAGRVETDMWQLECGVQCAVFVSSVDFDLNLSYLNLHFAL